MRINEFTLGMLERLEEIVCPRCGGSGEKPAKPGWSTKQPRPCDVCNGERRLWRLGSLAQAVAS